MKRVLKKALFPGIVVLLMVFPLLAAVGCGSSSNNNETTPTEPPQITSPTATVAPTVAPTATPTATTQATVNPDLETYKIGAVFAKTGNNAPLGQPEANVAAMLEKQINDAGGINGHKLNIVVYDTESDSTKCVLLAKKLIDEDKVSAIVGPTSSGESVALLDTVTKAEIPLVSCAASYKIVEPVADRYWVFSTPQKDKMAADTLFAYIQKQGITKIATIFDTAGFGQSGKGAMELEAPKYNITIVDEESFGSQDTDMTTQLTKIKGTDAQAIVCWGTNPGPAVIAKNVKTLGITLPLFNSHGIANQQFIDLAGDAANGVIFPAGKITGLSVVSDNDPQKPVLNKFLSDYQAAYNAFPNPYAGHAWDAIQMVAMAMKTVGNDKAKIRDYLENDIKNFAGISGVFNMSPQDHNGLSPDAFLMIKIVDGKWTVIPTVTATPSTTSTSAAPTPTASPTSTSASSKTLSDIYGGGKSLGDVKFDMVMSSSQLPQGMTATSYWKNFGVLKQMKFRMDASQQGMTMISLVDYGTQTMYMWIKEQNLAYKMDMSKAPSNPMANADQIHPTYIGTDTVDGHLCDVWQWTQNTAAGASTEKAWVWKDKSFPVKMVLTAPDGTTTIEYKNIVFGTLSDSLFELPAGVQVTAMPGMPGS